MSMHRFIAGSPRFGLWLKFGVFGTLLIYVHHHFDRLWCNTVPDLVFSLTLGLYLGILLNLWLIYGVFASVESKFLRALCCMPMILTMPW